MPNPSRIRIAVSSPDETIPPELHGQFIEHLGACIDGGIWVGEDSDIPNVAGLRKDLLDAIVEVAPPVVRWPGGCFADMYHWRDGIGPRGERPVRFNANFGTNRPETNEFGLHEFMDFCRRIQAEPWLNINLLAGSVAEMVEWAEYCNRPEGLTISKERAANGHAEPFNVKWWGIGNEAWAGGGTFTAEGYADAYRRYASAFPSFPVGDCANNLMPERLPTKLVAVGPDGNKPKERVEWTRRFFEAMGQFRMPAMDAFDLHFYNWNMMKEAGEVTSFTKEQWYRLLDGAQEIEPVLLEQHALIQASLPQPEPGPWARPPQVDLIVGEWGNWHPFDRSKPALWQQNTLRDAISYALTLDIFHRNCDKVKMACLAQTVNVLGALVLTDGAATVKTPSWHVFRMYMPHRRALRVPCETESETLFSGLTEVKAISSFASVKDGFLTLNVVNSDIEHGRTVELNFDRPLRMVSVEVLTHEDPAAHNTAECPDAVVAQHIAVDEPTVAAGQTIQVPARSVSVFRFEVA